MATVLVVALVVTQFRGGPRRVERVIPVAGVSNVNVSRDAFSQAEVAIAADPRRPNVLVAASNDYERGVLLYESRDGGRSWNSDETWPLRDERSCVDGDPAVAIDRGGWQFFAFLGDARCRGLTGVYVASRSGPGTDWIPAARPIGPGRRSVSDDKPALTVDASPTSPHRGRVYVAWARDVETKRDTTGTIVITHSDDHARTWSRLSPVSPATQRAVSSSIAISADGTAYVAWEDPGNQGIWIDRARDGVHFGSDHLVTSYLPIGDACEILGAQIPAQPHRCIRPNPTVLVSELHGHARRIYVVYGNIEANGSQAIFIAGFDGDLKPVLGNPAGEGGVRIGPLDDSVPSDQFWPAAALDTLNGRLWVCFYDTTGDRTRRSASYACVASSDGRKWLGPVRVATVASNLTVPPARHFEFGDFEGLAVARGVAHPIWTDSRELQTAREEIYTTRVTFRDIVRALRAGRGS